MSDRDWFFASQGQQKGPYTEAELREFIARGTVRADTLVWKQGMAAWQKAGEIPGLVSAGTVPRGATPFAVGDSGDGLGGALRDDLGDDSLSLDFGIWEFTWRSLVFFIGGMFVIPLPWVLIMYCRWIVARTQVPGRPNLTFTGDALTVAWWYFGAVVLLILTAFIALRTTELWLFRAVLILIHFGLYWLAIRWFVANLASNGQSLGLSFSGSYWAYLGWNILATLSTITIIGWAWVYMALMRWTCRHIEGTQREVVFKATGLQYLWRAVVTIIACAFIIPIPWALRWIMRWLASQIVLVERTTLSGA
jgi:GYF domain 2